MDNLPTWAVWIAALAVGIAPGLAILSAPAIARLLHRLLWPLPEVPPELRSKNMRSASGGLVAP